MFFRVTLKNEGEEYALDLSSAQYEYFEPIVPWKEFFRERILGIVVQGNGFEYFGGEKHYTADPRLRNPVKLYKQIRVCGVERRGYILLTLEC